MHAATRSTWLHARGNPDRRGHPGHPAAIVIPSSPTPAKTPSDSLTSSLHSLHGADRAVHAPQHGDKPPTLNGKDWSELTSQTTYSSRPTGPYLSVTPTNSVNGHSNVLAVTTDQTSGAAVAGSNLGFVYNTNNGKLWATNTTGDKIFATKSTERSEQLTRVWIARRGTNQPGTATRRVF